MSVRMMMQGRQPAAGGGGTFDPLSVSWLHAFWAEDPGWTNPGDGNGVSTWRNAGTDGAAAGEAVSGNQPTFRSSFAALNNRPALQFDGTNDRLFASTAAYAQANHVIAIGWLDSTTGANPTILDGNAARHLLRNLGPTNGVQMFAGTSRVFSGGAWGGFCIDALFNGASSECVVNGSTLTVGGTVGTSGLDDIDIGWDGAGAFFKGAIAFLAVKDTALTSTERSDLLAWSRSHYGTP